MPDQQIAAMGTEGRTAGFGITAAPVGQAFSERLLRRQSRAIVEQLLDTALQGQDRHRKRFIERCRRGAQPSAPLPAAGGDGDTVFRHSIFQSRQPTSLAGARLQQLIALAHGLLIGRHALSMTGIEAVKNAIKKRPAATGALKEQAVHLRGQPNQAKDGRKVGRPGAAHVNPDLAALPGASGSEAGADLVDPIATIDRCGNGPALCRPVASDFVETRPPEAAARAKQRQSLQQIGLAGAVRPGQHDGTAIRRQAQRSVVPEIRQNQPGDCRGRTGMGLLVRRQYRCL